LRAQDPCRRSRDLIRIMLADRSAVTAKEFDTSGKSPAYLHHRKKFGARAGKSAAGFLRAPGELFKQRYVGGLNSLMIQPDAVADLSGSPGSHFSQLNERNPLASRAGARIRFVPHLRQVGRSVCPTA
jgi:hypothetical protein